MPSVDETTKKIEPNFKFIDPYYSKKKEVKDLDPILKMIELYSLLSNWWYEEELELEDYTIQFLLRDYDKNFWIQLTWNNLKGGEGVLKKVSLSITCTLQQAFDIIYNNDKTYTNTKANEKNNIELKGDIEAAVELKGAIYGELIWRYEDLYDYFKE